MAAPVNESSGVCCLQNGGQANHGTGRTRPMASEWDGGGACGFSVRKKIFAK